MRQRHLARRLRALSVTCLETLEQRSLLHAGHDHGPTGKVEVGIEAINPIAPTGDHVPASTVLKAFPQLAGKDLWAPSTFNPTGSENRADWLYDPHFVEDDITPSSSLYPSAPRFGGDAGSNALPDLVPLTGGSYLNPFIDKTEIPGHNLLRFSTAVGNMGAGPAILTSANSGTPPFGSGISSWINPDGTQNVLQQLYDYNGSSFTFSGYRPAGRMVWHNGHSHFHLEGYANYRLLTRNTDGTPGPVAVRSGFDGSSAVGDKVGFCLVNILSTFTLPGTSTSSSTLPGYNKPGQPSTSCGFLQGISTGYADVYDSVYDGQWIDVTGVPNGQYFLEVTLDALNVIEETNEANNTVRVPITLNTSSASGGTVLPDRFEPNNTLAAATDLGELGFQTQPGLTAHITGESDFFKFTAASSGAYSVQLTIADRDMNLYLYNSAGALLGSSTQAASGTSTNPRTETVNATFVAGQTYYVEARAFGSDLSPTTSAISSNYALKVNVNPTVASLATDAISTEASLTDAMFNVARNGPTSSPLQVNFTVGGTATRGVDYNLFLDGAPVTGNSFFIGNEASSINLQVVPVADSLVEANETVILTLGSGAYVVGSGSSATIVINDIPPAVTVSAFAFETAQAVSFDFSLDVGASVSASDLVLTNLTTGQIIAASSVNYASATNRATFGFASALPNGNYRATVPGTAVTHALGVAMAADVSFDFFVLAGDLNRDRVVNFDDLLIVAQNFGTTGRTFSEGNQNYDAAGTVDFDDLLIIAQNFSQSLATSTERRSATRKRPGLAGDLL